MYLHSLVRTTLGGELGWCAPAELGDDAPHYVSFAIPLNEDNKPLPAYTCEVVQIDGEQRDVASYELKKAGADTFVLKVADASLWFTARPMSKGARLLYVGRLKHADFNRAFLEIEAEDQNALDKLCDEKGMFIIGCDPFRHYSGLLSPDHRLRSPETKTP